MSRQIQERTDLTANNPIAAAMRDVCVEDPSAECLMTFAMAYASTPFAGNFVTTIEQTLPFIFDGRVIAATQEGRNVSSYSLSRANLSHFRWLLAQDIVKAKEFLGAEAFTRADETTAEKLLAMALAESGNFEEAFRVAEVLYTDDRDWGDRFELVMNVMADYAAAAPEQAPALIEGLTGATDQMAGFAGLAVTLARNGELDKANEAFERALVMLAPSADSGDSDDGLIILAKALAEAGAFDLSRRAVEPIYSDLVRGWTAFDLAEAMFAAGRQEDALAMLNAVAPDHDGYRYYGLALGLGRTDLEGARRFVEGLEGSFQTNAAQGLTRALFEAGRSAEAAAVATEYEFLFGHSPRSGSDAPAFAALLAADGRVDEAVALAADQRSAIRALAFAAIAVALKGGDWEEVVRLAYLD